MDDLEPANPLRAADWVAVMSGNIVLIWYLVSGNLSLFDLLLLMSLEAIVLFPIMFVAGFSTGRFPASDAIGTIVGLIFLVGWGWIWTLAAMDGRDDALWDRLFSGFDDPHNLVRQMQIVIPFLATLAGVLLTRNFADLFRSAMSPALQLFLGGTLGLIAVVVGAEATGSGRFVMPLFLVAFLACRVGIDFGMRKAPIERLYAR